jgi:hypothetical protein
MTTFRPSRLWLCILPTRRAPSAQREGAAGFPQRQAERYPPLPRVAVGTLPLLGAEKKRRGEYPLVPFIASKLLAGRPGEPPQVCSPKWPISGEGALVRDASQKRFRGPSPGPVPSISRVKARWVVFSSDSCGARRPGFPHARCRLDRREPGSCSHREWNFGIGASSGGHGHRGRASLYYERTRPPGTCRCWVTVVYIAADVGPGQSVVHRVNDGAIRTVSIRRMADTRHAEPVVWALFPCPLAV